MLHVVGNEYTWSKVCLLNFIFQFSSVRGDVLVTKAVIHFEILFFFTYLQLEVVYLLQRVYFAFHCSLLELKLMFQANGSRGVPDLFALACPCFPEFASISVHPPCIFILFFESTMHYHSEISLTLSPIPI